MMGPNRRGKRCGSSEGKREPLSLSNTDLDSGARAGIELTLKTGKELRAAFDRAITASEFEEAEVWGKGALPSQARAA
jgi:hypothetical protein